MVPRVPYNALACAIRNDAFSAYSCAMSNDSGSGGEGRDGSGGVQSVDRAISVLEILARSGEAGCQRGGRRDRRAQVDRLPAARRPGGARPGGAGRDRGRYRLGFGILRLAGAMAGRLDVTARAVRSATSWPRELGETVNIAVLQVPLRDQRRPGARLGGGRGAQLGRPADPAARHLLRQGAAGPPASRRRATTCSRGRPGPRSPTRTITAAARCSTRSSTRCSRTGYAVTVGGVRGRAATRWPCPIRDHTGAVVAARQRLRSRLPPGPTSRMRTCSSRLEGAGARLADRMGHRLGHARTDPAEARPVRRRGRSGRAPSRGSPRCGARWAPGRRRRA